MVLLFPFSSIWRPLFSLPSLLYLPLSPSLVLHIHFSFPDFSKKRKKRERREGGERIPSIIFLSPARAFQQFKPSYRMHGKLHSIASRNIQIKNRDWSIYLWPWEVRGIVELWTRFIFALLPCCTALFSFFLWKGHPAFQAFHGHAISGATKAEKRNGAVATWRHRHSAAVWCTYGCLSSPFFSKRGSSHECSLLSESMLAICVHVSQSFPLFHMNPLFPFLFFSVVVSIIQERQIMPHPPPFFFFIFFYLLLLCSTPSSAIGGEARKREKERFLTLGLRTHSLFPRVFSDNRTKTQNTNARTYYNSSWFPGNLCGFLWTFR